MWTVNIEMNFLRNKQRFGLRTARSIKKFKKLKGHTQIETVQCLKKIHSSGGLCESIRGRGGVISRNAYVCKSRKDLSGQQAHPHIQCDSELPLPLLFWLQTLANILDAGVLIFLLVVKRLKERPQNVSKQGK